MLKAYCFSRAGWEFSVPFLVHFWTWTKCQVKSLPCVSVTFLVLLNMGSFYLRKMRMLVNKECPVLEVWHVMVWTEDQGCYSDLCLLNCTEREVQLWISAWINVACIDIQIFPTTFKLICLLWLIGEEIIHIFSSSEQQLLSQNCA